MASIVVHKSKTIRSNNNQGPKSVPIVLKSTTHSSSSSSLSPSISSEPTVTSTEVDYDEDHKKPKHLKKDDTANSHTSSKRKYTQETEDEESTMTSSTSSYDDYDYDTYDEEDSTFTIPRILSSPSLSYITTSMPLTTTTTDQPLRFPRRSSTKDKRRFDEVSKEFETPQAMPASTAAAAAAAAAVAAADAQMQGAGILAPDIRGPLMTSVWPQDISAFSSVPMNRVSSMPSLTKIIQTRTQTNRRTPITIIRGRSNNTSQANTGIDKTTINTDPFADTNPDDFVKSILQSNGYPCTPIPSLEVEGNYFLKHTEAQIASYDIPLTTAVRSEDLSTLKTMHKNGKILQCANRFGESIIHIACRRASIKLMEFLLGEDVGLNLRVVDDFGRTPLHDACWTREPAFEIVAMLIQREPDMLLLEDKRGSTPLKYVRREHWGDWCRFFDERRNLIRPKTLVRPK